ncbi:hypothetical protein TWF696_005466 [Orbilia brochopaga]|uniref:Uncharacterized protein n=1 Tax=Orbilia brochopaga TaxID=3140254 RepID=A0AAV9V4R6_9PEZI
MSLKRKRGGTTSTPAAAAADVDASADDVFRRHFEARFGSVDLSPAATPKPDAPRSRIKATSHRDDEDTKPSPHSPSDGESSGDKELDDEEASWDGIDDSPTPPVEVVSYDFSRPLPPPSTKPSRATFMSAKPPSSSSNPPLASTSKPVSAKEAAQDAANLQNDAALHRLLTESHLLDSTLTHASARHRQQALESRIVALGGTPLSKLDGTASRTPMAIRRGMARAQESREEKIRTAAREGGIVLAKSQMKKKRKAGTSSSSSKRDRGVGGPAVGKFRRGALVLSQRDVAGMRA